MDPVGDGKPADRIFAMLMALAAAVSVGWLVRKGLDSWGAGVGAAVLAAALLYWVLTRRVRADLRTLAQPIPESWAEILDEALPYFRLLPADRRRRFLRRVQLFLADQRISGVGCHPTEEDRLLLAGAAVMMTEGVPGFRLPSHREFLIYPTSFDEETYEHDWESDQVGQVLHAGPVILSLPELRRGFTDEDWSNVAIHELAHILDGLWSRLPGEYDSEYDSRLDALLQDPKLQRTIVDGDSPIDDYALEDPQEFFAVTSEVFFEDPLLLRDLHPRIYDWLAEIYRQDPAELFERGTEP